MLNILKISVSIDKCIKLSTFKKIKHLKITVHFTHTHTHTHTPQVVSRNPYLIPPKLVSPTKTIPLGFFYPTSPCLSRIFKLRSLTPTEDLHPPVIFSSSETDKSILPVAQAKRSEVLSASLLTLDVVV